VTGSAPEALAMPTTPAAHHHSAAMNPVVESRVEMAEIGMAKIVAIKAVKPVEPIYEEP
jgi:hypothetical protein